MSAVSYSILTHGKNPFGINESKNDVTGIVGIEDYSIRGAETK